MPQHRNTDIIAFHIDISEKTTKQTILDDLEILCRGLTSVKHMDHSEDQCRYDNKEGIVADDPTQKSTIEDLLQYGGINQRGKCQQKQGEFGKDRLIGGRFLRN